MKYRKRIMPRAQLKRSHAWKWLAAYALRQKGCSPKEIAEVIKVGWHNVYRMISQGEQLHAHLVKRGL